MGNPLCLPWSVLVVSLPVILPNKNVLMYVTAFVCGFLEVFLEILQVPRWLGRVSPRSINSSLLNMSSLRIPCGITQGLPTALSVNFRWLLLSVSSVRKESYNLVSLQGVFKVQHRLPSLSCYVLRVVVSSTSVCAVHFCRNRSIGPRVRLLRVSWSLFFPGEFLSTAS